MAKIKSLFETSLIGIVFGFVAAISFIVFKPLFTAANSATRDGFQGAFMGAVFAFIFVRLGDALTRIYQRLAKNQSSLVRLQHHLNDCLGLTSDNIFIINEYMKIFENYHADIEEPKIFGNELHQLPIDKEIPLALTNLEFVNDMYSYQESIRKLNNSMATANRIVNQTTTSFVQGHIAHKTYAANINHYKNTMTTIKAFLEAIKKDTLQLYASARVQSKDNPFLSKIIQQAFKHEFTTKQREQVAKEIQKVEREISSIAATSRAKISDIQDGRY